MLLDHAVEGLLLDRDGEAKADSSYATISLYRHCLGLLVEFLGNPEIKAITSNDLARYINYLEKDYQPKRKGVAQLSGYCPDNHWKAIRSLFHWANQELGTSRIDEGLPQPIVITEEVARALKKR